MCVDGDLLDTRQVGSAWVQTTGDDEFDDMALGVEMSKSPDERRMISPFIHGIDYDDEGLGVLE
jgi:hypothetical protein